MPAKELIAPAPWKEIEALPEYQALDGERRQKAFDGWKKMTRDYGVGMGLDEATVDTELDDFTGKIAQRGALAAVDTLTLPYRLDWKPSKEEAARQIGPLALERDKLTDKISSLKRQGPGENPVFTEKPVTLGGIEGTQMGFLSDWEQQLSDSETRLRELDAQIGKLDAIANPKKDQFPDFETWRRQEIAAGRMEAPGLVGTAVSELTGGLLNQAAGALRTVAPSLGTGALAENVSEAAGTEQANAALNEGVGGQIGRGIGAAGSLLIGNPAGKLGTVAAATRAAQGAHEQVLRETHSPDLANEAALKTFPAMLAYMTAGRAAARIGGRLAGPDATALGRAVSGAGTATAGNVVVSRALADLEGRPWGLQKAAQDVLFGVFHGTGEYRNASEEIRKAAELEIERQGLEVPEAVPLGSQEAETGKFPEVNLTPVSGEPKGEPNAEQISQNGRAYGGLRAPEVAGENAPLPAPEGGEGIQPSGQGGLAAEAPSEAQPEEVARNLGPGAANAEEPLGAGPPIGTFNAKVDEQRAARGLEPLVSEARKSDAEMWDRTQARIESDPELPSRMTDQILSGEIKTPSDEDQTVLLHRMVDLHTRRMMESERINDPNLSEGERAEAELRWTQLESELQRTEEADRKGGTAQGRALRARRIMANEDFTLAAMEARARVAKGAPLTPEESSKIQQQSARIAELEKQLSERQSAKTEEEAGASVDEAIRQIEADAKKNPDFTPEVRSLADRIISRLDAAADAALSRLRGKFARVSAGVDPTILSDLVIYGSSKIAKGLVKFGQWSAAMVRELGDGVKPYLEEAWKGANESLDAAVERVPTKQREKVKAAVKKTDLAGKREEITGNLAESAKEGTPLAEMRSDIQRLAENFVRSGIKEREPLIDAVHEVLKTIDPKIERRQTMDLISGYGDFKPLNADEIKAQLRDLKGQMQQVAKLEDITAHKPLQKTGVERRAPSDTERRLIQQVNEAKRKFGVVVTDPARQLKSALDARKTYVRNRLSDLRSEISTRTRIVKERSLPPSDSELDSLRAEYDTVKAEHEAVFGKREMTDAQRLKLAIGAAERSEAQWAKRLVDAQKGVFPTGKAPSKTPKSAQLDAIKARVEAVKSQVAELKALDVGIQERAKEAAITKSIAELEARIKAGDIEPKTGTPTADTQAVAELKAKRDALQKHIADARKAANPPKPEHVRQLEALNKRIAETEARIAAGDISVKSGKPTVATKEVAEAKARLAELNQQLRTLRAGPKKTPEEIAIQALKSRATARIADMQDRMARGDFAPKKRRQYDVSKDPEAVRLLAEKKNIQDQYNKQKYEWQQAQRSRAQKAIDFTKEFLGSSRQIITSADVSAPFRQGGILLMGDMVLRPDRAARQLGNMFRELVSQKKFDQSEASIRARPNAELYEKSKLHLSDPHGRFTQREENMRADLAEKIPVVGSVIRGSNRAYAGFLNRQRADAFDAFVSMLGGKDRISDADARFLAEAVNDMTGRAELSGKAIGVANWLARYLFSPRYLMSRFKFLVGEPIWRDITKGEVSARARGVVALQYIRFAAGLAAFYGLASMMGGKVEKDPRSSDFGKAKFGDTRVDPLTGLAQLIVLTSRLVSGKTKKLTGELRPIRGKGMTIKDQSATDLLAAFGRSKLAPIPGAVVDVAQGQTMDLEPVTPASEAIRLTVPISYQDSIDIYKAQGPLKGTIMQALNLLGFGVQHYGKHKPRR